MSRENVELVRRLYEAVGRRDVDEAWERLDYDVVELIDAGDHVVSVVTRRGRGRASGVVGELTVAVAFTIREGRIVRLVWFPTRGEALEAVVGRDR